MRKNSVSVGNIALLKTVLVLPPFLTLVCFSPNPYPIWAGSAFTARRSSSAFLFASVRILSCTMARQKMSTMTRGVNVQHEKSIHLVLLATIFQFGC